MRELLFNQAAEQETFQVSSIHRLRKFSHEDLESQATTLINYQLPVTNYQLPITNYFLPFTFFLFSRH